MLAVDLEWEKSVGALRRAEAELTAEDKKRAQELWHKVRVMVRVGQLKKRGSEGSRGGGSVELPSSQHTSDTDPSPSAGRGLREWLGAYGEKWKGNRANKPPPRATWTAGAWTLVGALLGMLLPSALHTALVRHTHSPSLFLMVGSYGALATLLFGAPASPFAQPRIVLGGHLQASVVAVAVDYLVDSEHTDFSTAFIPLWVALALVPALCITLMSLTGYTNPPSAACAFIYIAGAADVKAVGWMYVVVPSLLGCCLMILVALIVNNLSAARYPTFW